MKNITLLIILFSQIAHAQTFDNAKNRYEADSVFTVMVDSAGHNYCNIHPTTSFACTYTKIIGVYWCDYGSQPYQILPIRDSLIVFHLDAIIGLTKSGACSFTIVGSTNNQNESISINNINSNAYTASELYGWKFRYWYLADKLGLTIE